MPALPVNPARDDERAALVALLVAAGLPVADLPTPLDGFFVVRDGGRVVGCAGVETRGDFGLLRSVAVADTHRARGLAQALVAHAIAQARSVGVREVYLLTTTARGYFERLGFSSMPRDAAPVPIQQSSEFTTTCPSTAVVMRRAIVPA